MVTIKYDTELAVRAMLPEIKRRLRGFELAVQIEDDELVNKLTDTLLPVIEHRKPTEAAAK